MEKNVQENLSDFDEKSIVLEDEIISSQPENVEFLAVVEKKSLRVEKNEEKSKKLLRLPVALFAREIALCGIVNLGSFVHVRKFLHFLKKSHGK